MPDPQDFTDDELLTVYKNPKSDLSKLTPGELRRLDTLTMPAVDRATMRAQGDAAAAREQQRLTNQPVFSMANAGKDLVSAGKGLYGVLKTLGTAAVTNPYGLNQPDIRYDPAAHANDPSLRQQASSVLGTLRTLPGRAWSALTTDPRETALEAGITPDVAAQGIGAATGIGLTAAIANEHIVPSAAGIRAGLTRFAEDVPIVKGIKPGLDAYKAAAQSDADAIGQFRGTLRTNPAMPRQLSYGPELVSPGGTPPPAAPPTAPAAPVQPGGPDLFERMRQEGVRFDTAGTGAGQVGPVPPPKPNVLLRANDLNQILEEVRQTPEPGPTAVEAPPEPTVTPGGRPSLTAQQYAELEQGSPGAGAHAGAPESAYAPNPVSEPTGPPPRLVKGGGPSLQDALITALEDVRQEGGEAGTTPPDVTLTEAGKPSVTPERASQIGETAPPAGTTRQIQPEVPPTLPKPGNPIPADDLIGMLEEARQQPTNDPVTTASAAPPQELTPGGRPSQTQAEYDALQEAAMRRQALEKAVGAQTASSAVQAETPAAAAEAEAPLPTQSVVPPPTSEALPAAEPTTTTPSPAELTPDEVRRKEIGARDFAAEQRRESGVTETPDEVRARTRARTTGQTEQVSTLSTKALNRVVGTLKDMIANGATDAELRDYINRAPGDTAKKAIGVAVNTLLHGTGRDVVGIAGATALTGAALRQALVGQLQGDQKEQD